MGIVKWQDMPVFTGDEWTGVSYFTTLRLPSDAFTTGLHGREVQAGASVGAYASLNFGDHVEDAPQAVLANRRRLSLLLPQEPVWLEQVHGVDVFDADANLPIENEPKPVADAAITSKRGRVLCAFTADCLPVVLSDLAGSTLGVAHAGWRGLKAGVLENTLTHLRARAPTGSRWRAWIGPAIGQAAFEVGAEVREAFVDHDHAAAAFFVAGANAGKWQADLAGLAVHRLHQAGVEQVQAGSPCTHRRSDLFYSYRRDGKTGRMATLAWLHGSDLP